ncbi:MAG TPA: hypothetical protein VK518_01920 [Puia sp.]|nr:hypothetical protein [Puia sp.]
MGSIVNKTLVESFYRQNAGFFVLLFVLFFGVVAPSEQLAYHYTLILGMLETPLFLGIVLFAWLLYGLKTSRFLFATLDEPEANFLFKLGVMSPGRLFRLCMRIQGLLFLPVWAYSFAVMGVAIYRHTYREALLVALYMAVINTAGAVGLRMRLLFPGRRWVLFMRRRPRRRVPYWSILIRYLLKEEKALVGGIKVFSCTTLYLLLRDQGPDDYDLRMPFLFYSLSLFGHGAILYRCRQLENTRLLFYRALSVSQAARFGQYALFYLLLLLPEMFVLGWLTPHPIRVTDTIAFLLSGYSVLLLMNSILYTAPFTNRVFLRLCLLIFGILYCCVLGNYLIVLSEVFLVTATFLFFRRYARYEMWA